MAPAASVAVVGGGIVGICTALSLAEAGVDTLLIDRDEPGQGTSFGNAGVISPWSVVPQSGPGVWRKIPGWLLRPDGPAALSPRYALRMMPWLVQFLRAGRASEVTRISEAMQFLNQDNVALYRRHLAGTGFEDLITDSYYVHAYRDAAQANADAGEYRMRRAIGADIDRIGAAELRTLEPALSPQFQAAIVIKGQARARDPGKIGQVLAGKFQSAGGRVLRAGVTALTRTDTGWIVHTDAGDIPAPKVVLSAGAWSARLLKPLGLKVPLAAERGYHVGYADPGVTLTHSVMDVDGKVVASSMVAGLRVAGTAEFADPDAPPNPRRVASLNRLARAMIPDLNPERMTSWMGVRPSLPDSLPMIGEFANHPGLITAFGHSHYGLMMAPKTGHLVTGIVQNTPANADLSAYAPDRFA